MQSVRVPSWKIDARCSKIIEEEEKEIDEDEDEESIWYRNRTGAISIAAKEEEKEIDDDEDSTISRSEHKNNDEL